MGILDILNPQPMTPSVPSALPDVAKQQILSGCLPALQPDTLFLKKGEICHYAEKAIYEKRTVNKKRIRKNTGYSVPGLFKGTRIHVGGGNTEYVDDVKYSTVKGILYITTNRLIFVSAGEGFDRRIEDLVAVTPYANCIEFQFSKETLKLFVPDGNLPHIVLRLLSQ